MSGQTQILVDTDVLIDFLRGKDGARTVLEAALARATLCISVITLTEILAGMRPKEEKATEALIKGFVLLPVSESVARIAGQLRNHHRSVLLPDCLIAATTLHEQADLLTFNRRDYPFEGIVFV